MVDFRVVVSDSKSGQPRGQLPINSLVRVLEIL